MSILDKNDMGKERDAWEMEKGKRILRAVNILNCSLVEDGIEISGYLGNILCSIQTKYTNSI